MEENCKKVTLSDIDIPFWSLVMFMVKLALASIPAFIIIYFIFSLLGLLLGGFFSMFVFHPMM
ncbi:hypothetical protein [Nitrosophilus alvini]|uniref:hypothetical protein n=1 Tax=Nitrosophilus alvini TaxID=2714855 RepID=UPI00190C8316|nr:hypothetical protein [Nitrosophilus alvini]